MAEFKINRIRYRWKNNWAAATAYIRDDIIRYGGMTFVCTAGHTSSSNFYSDSANWTKMTNGQIWESSWASTIVYKINDIVLHGGKVYICNTGHTSSSTFEADINKWSDYVISVKWRDDWATSTLYAVGDLVQYGGTVYVCINEHISSVSASLGIESGAVPDDSTLARWEIYYDNISYQGNFTIGFLYRVNDLVKYGGTVWRCIEEHTSGSDSTVNFTPEFWVLEFPGQQFRGEWQHHVVYSIGDVARYGGYIYISLKINESEIPTGNTGDWKLVSKNYNFRGLWSKANDYKSGDVVLFGGRSYVADADFTGQLLTDIIYVVTIVDPVSGEIGYKYNINNQYKPGLSLDIGYSYIFDQSNRTNLYYPNNNGTTLNQHPLHFSKDEANGVLDGGTNYTTDVIFKLDNVEVTAEEYVSGFSTALFRTVTLTPTINTPTLYYWCVNHRDMGSTISFNTLTEGIDPNSDANWKSLTEGISWKGGWLVNVQYGIGDEVRYVNKNYRCVQSHLSNQEENYPGNGNGFNYWVGSLEGDDQNALSNIGDFITYGALDDVSTIGPKPISIGLPNQLLSIDATGEQYYKYFNQSYNYRYVATNGVDSPERGTRPDNPWKTVRYACQQVEKLTGSTSILISAGSYSEILPIIIPASCSIVGDELRSVTIKAAPAVESLALDVTYTLGVLNRIRDIIPDLILNVQITPLPGNTVNQNISLSVGSIGAATSVQNLIDDIENYIDFYLQSGPTDPTVVGTNIATADESYHRAAAILIANKDFIAAEAVAYMDYTYPLYTFNSSLCERDVKEYVDAWIYDIVYTGNYKSILAARYYRNAVLGSASEDMFYVRDASSIKNVTLNGLSGSLNPPNTYDLYRSSTGGSYISLDAGWGPNDDRVWISTRSPYIQNVTTFGTGCVGQKIDGDLHNGGNKSIVSNDFTQVISDGIGAWVLNKGRAELVSVFTYYCHVGYLAEQGGTIRATNGNNSYGKYGALAQGVDPDEIPQYGIINSKNNEATVIATLAGEFANEILVLEYGNAGQEYTQVEYTVIGSGTDADLIAEDFRDGAVYQSRIVTAGDSTGLGGGGFLIVGNNAQTGDETTITLASSDGNTAFEYLGMRIIIVSGPGTGQYGYVTAYNNVSKVLSVSKESDNQPGWDHVILGTPILEALTTQTTYRIEPRPIFSNPTTTISSESIPLATYSQITFGDTFATYSNVAGELGTGSVEGQDGLVPVVARFNITKTGRKYSVTLASGGAGYAIDDEITILGTTLGGVSPANDITIQVLTVSDDSTNSILTFNYDGKGSSGQYVVVTADSSSLSYSSNGVTWSTTSLASSGNWIVSAGGTEFVAIKSSSTAVAYSRTGASWQTATMPASSNWTSAVYGRGTWVAVASNSNSGAYSEDRGATWTTMSLPIVGDSTVSQWRSVTYGKGKFVAISSSNQAFAYSTDGISWIGGTLPGIAVDWISIAYGNNRFVAISNTAGAAAISFDGITWIASEMPSSDGSTAHSWKNIKYGQGVFFAVGDTGGATVGGDVTLGPSTYAAKSEDGVTWSSVTFTSEGQWADITFGNPLDIGTWIAVASDTASTIKIVTGVRAKGRVSVLSGRITEVKLWDPGSGYTSSPTLTIVDPNNTSELFTENRIGNGVLGQPSFVNRGNAYKTSSTSVTISGNGYSDVVPVGAYVTLERLDFYPRLGSQITFEGYEQIYSVSNIEILGGTPGNYSATFQVSPTIDIQDNFYHGLEATIRERYSQCRLTGHDFLDIGVGNFIESNYPDIDVLNRSPENEIVEGNGGRVFYTSTDQDGNFRVGELFQVEQATGIVTISADFFDLGGLTELALGGVRLGGSGTVIREFSTDATFTENSNNIVPTQRAIRSYLQNRLSQGGSELTTAAFIAGQTVVGPDLISTVTGTKVQVPVRVDFTGSSAIRGSIMAQTMFYNASNMRRF